MGPKKVNASAAISEATVAPDDTSPTGKIGSPNKGPLQRLRDNLVLTGYYLGDNNIQSLLDKVTFHRLHTENILITKESLAKVEEITQQIQAAREAGELNDSSEPITIPGLEFAGLDITGKVSADTCFVSPDGFWKGPTENWKEFKKLRLNFTLVEPSSPMFKADFATAIKNFKAVMGLKVREGELSKCQGALRTDVRGEGPGLRFNHDVFQPKDKQDLPAKEYEIAMQDWPCFSREAEIERNNISDSHLAFALPIRDFTGAIVPPEKVRDILPGALVHINFKVVHWFIYRDKRNTFNIFPNEIRILEMPIVFTTTPTKRKTLSETEELDKEGKKQKV